MKTLFLFLISAFAFLSSYAQEQSAVYKGEELDLRNYKIASLYKGDGAVLIQDKLDGSAVYELVSKEKNNWSLVLNFQLEKHIAAEQDIWMQLRSSIGAAEVYVNDHLLFENGKVGQSVSTEIIGKNLVRKRIPKNYLLEENNTIKLVFSNFKSQDGAAIRDLALGNLEDFQEHSFIMSMAPILFSGIFIFAFFINIALYFSLERNQVFLLLAILFLVNFLLVAYEALYWNGLVPSASFIHSYTLRRGLEYAVYFILVLVLYFEYELKPKSLLIALSIFLAVSFLVSFTDYVLVLVISFLPFAFSLYASIKKMRNSYLITLSLLLVFLLNYIDEYNIIEDYDFVYSNPFVTSVIYKLDNLGMVVFAIVMIFTSAKGILLKTNALNEAHLQLERLEYQFLQKHIQPHFLMNSLMSLQQLISKDTKNAKVMIEALSEEFHLLTAMSRKKQVGILEEIDMCKTHLQIMSIQHKADYKMVTKGIKGDELIPPAVIHTLVENGITHGYSGSQNAYFELSKIEAPAEIQYRLFNDSDLKNTKTKATTGTGLKYVEARLQECYPDSWQLLSNRIEGGWEVLIKIKKK
jgi:hypothetical protein